MILKKAFELVDIAGEHMAIPVGDEAASFHGIIALSNSAFFLLNNMREQQTKESLLELLMNEYEVDVSVAKKDLDELIQTLLELGVVEE